MESKLNTGKGFLLRIKMTGSGFDILPEKYKKIRAETDL